MPNEIMDPSFGNHSLRYGGRSKWQDADGFYEKLIDCHQGLSLEQSHKLNARLVLMLANEVADSDLLAELLRAARRGLVT